MRSIRWSMAVLVFVSTLAFGLLLGYMSVFSLVTKSDADANTAMNLMCANEAARIDAVLKGVEDSVEIEASYVHEELTLDPARAHDSAWLALTDQLFETVAKGTDNVVMYYLAVGGSIAEPYSGAPTSPTGFLYLRKNWRDFAEQPFARGMELFPQGTSADELGWDAQQLMEGKDLWIEPFSANDGLPRMITYIRPIMIDGAFMGVVGMGVDFAVVESEVQSFSGYQTGYGFLTDAQGNVMYHPSIPFGTNLSDDDEEIPEVDQAIAAGTTKDIVAYRFGGADKRMAFHVLRNGMRLVLSVDASEIYGDRNRLIAMLTLTTIAASLLFLTIVLGSIKHVLRPLYQLTESAKQVAEGHLDVNILETETEELASLVVSYKATVEELRRQVKFNEQLARCDALTGLLNKMAFSEALDELDAQAEAGAFAFVMLDANNLKKINDEHGHEAGDAYLQAAAAEMQAAFDGLALYRVGGDEFVVVAGATDHDVVKGGIAQIEDRCEQLATQEGLEDWERVSLAVGHASHREAEEPAETLARADARMYQRKQDMKVTR